MKTRLDADHKGHGVTVETISFDATSLHRVRDTVSRRARAEGLRYDRAEAIVLAVHELAANSVRHGGGAGVARVWVGDGRFCCEVADRGVLGDSQVGSRPPAPGSASGRGLWIVRQLCDGFDITTGPHGTVVCVHMELTGATHPDRSTGPHMASATAPRVQFASVTRDGDARPGGAGGGDERDNLAIALDAGNVGTWTWDIASGTTEWDPRLEELHGLAPGTFGGTFDDWFATIHPDDRDECVARVERALATRSPYVLLHRTTWADTSVHWIECRGTVIVDERGDPTGTTGVGFDVTPHKVREAIDAEQLARRQRLVETLQVALLPADPPQVDGITFATRYVSARGPGEVGGDWYSVIPLDAKRLGIAIGDVAGHGLAAVAEMAAARFGLRALAVIDPAPDLVLERMNQHVRLFEGETMITSLYGILDPAGLTWTYANAGHCPPVVRHCDGRVGALPPTADPPLGFGGSYQVHEVDLSPGATVVLYTDGLIERRGEDISIGIARLVEACRSGPERADLLCDHLLDRLLHDAPNDDDVAVVVLTLD